jgi:hypothetical protein
MLALFVIIFGVADSIARKKYYKKHNIDEPINRMMQLQDWYLASIETKFLWGFYPTIILIFLLYKRFL